MNWAVKTLIATIAAFLGIAYTLIFKTKKAQSNRIEIGQRPGEQVHW